MSGEREFPATAMSDGGELYPLLVYQDGRRNPHSQTFCRISSTGLESSSIEPNFVPESQNAKVLYCSSDGCWLLLLHTTETDATSAAGLRLSIWNPVTGKFIGLPPVKRPNMNFFSFIDKGQALLSSSPTDPRCLVYLFIGFVPLILYCQIGHRNWSELLYAQTIEAQGLTCLKRHRLFRGFKMHDHICCRLEQPVSFDGCVYALSSCSNELFRISVDPSSNLCSTTLMETKRQEDFPIGSLRVYLVSWGDQELYRITISLHKSVDFKCVEVPEIAVSKFSFGACSPCWDDEQVMSLNGGAIFLSSRNSLALPWCLNGKGGKWSSIYFTSSHNQTLYEYRMEDEKITSCSPSPLNLTEPWLPLWIIPADQTGQNHWIEHSCPQINWRSCNCSSMMRGLKRKMMMVDQGNGSAGFCDLMPEMLNTIAENLSSFIDYIHFRRYTKACAKVGPRKNPFHPCLMYRDKVKDVYQYHVTDFNLNQKLHVKIPKELRGKKICCSRDGWLLLGDGTSYTLFNPFTNKIVETVGKGRSPIPTYSQTLVGQLSPSAPENCLVLEVSTFSGHAAAPRRLPGNPAEPGKAEWWVMIVMNFVPSCNSGVLFGGWWYYLGLTGNIGRLMLSEIGGFKSSSVLEWEVLEGFTCPCEGFTRNYLTECGGDLVSIFAGDEGKEKPWVRVFRMGDQQKWEEIDSLKGYSLYLGLPSSMSCLADRLDMADRLYFPRFHKGGLVYYSLKTKKYHSIGNEQSELKNAHSITMFSSCAWIKPEWSS